jgi:hypothetical protein
MLEALTFGVAYAAGLCWASVCRDQAAVIGAVPRTPDRHIGQAPP